MVKAVAGRWEKDRPVLTDATPSQARSEAPADAIAAFLAKQPLFYCQAYAARIRKAQCKTNRQKKLYLCGKCQHGLEEAPQPEKPQASFHTAFMWRRSHPQPEDPATSAPANPSEVSDLSDKSEPSDQSDLKPCEPLLSLPSLSAETLEILQLMATVHGNQQAQAILEGKPWTL